MATEFEHPTAVELKAEVRTNPWTVHWDIEHRGRQLVDEGEYRRLARRKARTLTIKLPPTADEWRTLAWDMANSLSAMWERGPWSLALKTLSTHSRARTSDTTIRPKPGESMMDTNLLDFEATDTYTVRIAGYDVRFGPLVSEDWPATGPLVYAERRDDEMDIGAEAAAAALAGRPKRRVIALACGRGCWHQGGRTNGR